MDQLDGRSQATPQALHNSLGQSSGATVAWNTPDGYENNVGGTATANQRLLYGYLNQQNGGAITATITGIPTAYQNATYDVYVYFGTNDGGHTEVAASINGLGTTYYGTQYAVTTQFIQATSTSSAAPTGSANYAEFTNLSASSLTVNLVNVGGNWYGMNGIEIVENPPAGGNGLNVLPVTTPLTVVSGATFDLGGGTQTVASLSNPAATPGLAGTVLNSGSSTSILTLAGTGGSTTFSGLIAGGGSLGNLSLIMAGPGCRTWPACNTYTGGTQVTGGTLQLGNASAFGTARWRPTGESSIWPD